MAKDFESLKQQALVIKNEVEDGANNTERVGGMLEDIVESMKLGTCEFNVSSFYPTSGISGGNKYTLETAIVQVPAELRTAGLKVSFQNSAGKPESWKYQGGSWAVANFVKEADGGNKILTWVTDAATTRKQVSTNERKGGLQITYKPDGEDWINEQYIGTSFTDTEWAKDENWEKIAKGKSVKEIDSKLSKSVFRKTEFTKNDAVEKYENFNVSSNGFINTNDNYDFYLFDASNLSLDCALAGSNIYFTFTDKPENFKYGIVLKNFKYHNVIDKTLSLDSTIKYIGLNVEKTVSDTTILFKDVSGTNFLISNEINQYLNIEGTDSDFLPSGISQISKTKIFNLKAGEVYIVNKTSPAGMSRFVGLYKGEPSDDTLIFNYNIDKVRIVVPSEDGDYKLVVALANSPVSVGQNLKVIKIENLNSPLENYLSTSQFADKRNDYYDIRKR